MLTDGTSTRSQTHELRLPSTNFNPTVRSQRFPHGTQAFGIGFGLWLRKMISPPRPSRATYRDVTEITTHCTSPTSSGSRKMTRHRQTLRRQALASARSMASSHPRRQRILPTRSRGQLPSTHPHRRGRHCRAAMSRCSGNALLRDVRGVDRIAGDRTAGPRQFSRSHPGGIPAGDLSQASSLSTGNGEPAYSTRARYEPRPDPLSR